MEKLKMQSPDIVSENMNYIAERFPNCVTESLDDNGKPIKVIDFDQLRQELSKDIVEGPKERYQFTWPDKHNSIRLANTPTTDTLRPCREDSVDFDTTQNLYIEGDNLEVLKLLREDYLGKVKMIYIDPPYNTGKDFLYNDDFAQDSDEYVHNSGQEDEEGNRLVTNTESNGRFHTDWLNMMYPRLKVAKDLLTEDGVIFISIDDNEVENLRKICDEIFGKKNLVACMVWEQGRKSMATQIAVNHEYCLIYNKNKAISVFSSNGEYPFWRTKKKGLKEIYSEYERLKSIFCDDYSSIEKGMKIFYMSLDENNPSKAHSHYKCVDKKGLYFPGDIAQGTGNGGRFEILHPITGKPCKMPKGGWRFSADKLPLLLKERRIHFGSDESTIPCLKRYLKETEYEVMPSVFYKDGRGASMRLEELFGVKGLFPFPKDEEIIKSFVSVAVENKNDIILDFFSGSATTAHAVMQLNAEDGGNRKFIMVQIPELTDEDSEAYKAGYKNICEIGKERIRRAGKKIKEELSNKTIAISVGDNSIGWAITDENNKIDDIGCAIEPIEKNNTNPFDNAVEKIKKTVSKAVKLDTGFRVLKLDSSNMDNVFYTPGNFSESELFTENIKSDRTHEDLLFQTMLELGIELSAKIEKKQIAGKDVFMVSDGYLIACFDTNVDEGVIKEIAKQKPYYFVMRDSSLEKDNVADNFDQIFDEYSKDTIRKIL